MEPKIRYCKTSDGVAIAYAIVGEGPPLLYARRFMAPGVDDELRFSFSQWGPLAAVRSVILWDMRGSGLSEAVPGTNFDEWICDMEAVVAALGVDRIDLGAELTPCHFAIAFAARHQDRVGRMILWNPTHSGFSPRTRQPAWLRDLAGIDWDAFADVSTHRMFGWERAEAGARFADRLRKHFTRETYERTMDAVESVEAGHLAPSVRAPTLVVADENFFMHDWSRAERQAFMRKLAAEIPAAELAIIKPGDAEGSGRTAVRFLEPSVEVHGDQASGGGTAGATAIIMFADIAGSTALTEHLGDAAFRERARALDDGLRAAVHNHGGITIDAKTLGDGVLATFPSASQAIAAAVACAEAGRHAELPLHIGLHAGDVIRESDNVYGGAVNIAARISALAAPGEVLVSDIVRGLARTSAGVTFDDRGEQALKGVADAQRVFAVRRSEK